MASQVLAPNGTVQTSLKSWGTSRGVRIPKKLCEWMGVAVGSKLTMNTGSDDRGSFIMIRPAGVGHRSFAAAPCISMDEAFAGYDGGYAPTEADWGEDVGAERAS